MLLTCWCFLVAPQLARAHQVETVEFEFQKLDRDWRLVGEMDIAYMLPETRKVPGGPPLRRKASRLPKVSVTSAMLREPCCAMSA